MKVQGPRHRRESCNSLTTRPPTASASSDRFLRCGRLAGSSDHPLTSSQSSRHPLQSRTQSCAPESSSKIPAIESSSQATNKVLNKVSVREKAFSVLNNNINNNNDDDDDESPSVFDITFGSKWPSTIDEIVMWWWSYFYGHLEWVSESPGEAQRQLFRERGKKIVMLFTLSDFVTFKIARNLPKPSYNKFLSFLGTQIRHEKISDHFWLAQKSCFLARESFSKNSFLVARNNQTNERTNTVSRLHFPKLNPKKFDRSTSAAWRESVRVTHRRLR